MQIPIVSEMFSALAESVDALKERISNVRLAVYSGENFETITFDLDGKSYIGNLKGRNAELCIGHGKASDKAIAARVLLDGDAKIA